MEEIRDSLRTADGVTLAARRWTPPPSTGAEPPRAAVALVHGYAEHAARYRHVAAAFATNHGLETFAVDLRGHGESEGPAGHVRRFAEYQRDVDALLAWIGRERPGVPVVVLAHSMGGLIAVDRYSRGTDDGVRRLALSSPYLGLLPRPWWIQRVGIAALAAIVPRFPIPIPLAGAKLCTDPEIAAEHDADPKVLHRTTARWVHESLATHRAVRERASGITLPTLVLYAADDCIADPAATAAFVQREPAVRGEALDQRHEVLNAAEPERSAIIERFGRFLSGLGTDSPNDA